MSFCGSEESTSAALWAVYEVPEQLGTAVFSLQVARKLVILEGELERAEERAEVSEV